MLQTTKSEYLHKVLTVLLRSTPLESQNEGPEGLFETSHDAVCVLPDAFVSQSC